MSAWESYDTWEDEGGAINSPSHYNQGKIECIDALEASMSSIEYEGYLKGSAIKYLWRCRYKNNMVEDLNKSIWYSQRLAKHILAVKERLDAADARTEWATNPIQSETPQ